MTADEANCVRVVACIGTEGIWFNGRAFGRGEGTFSETTSTGLMCEGTWMSRNAFGLGQADDHEDAQIDKLTPREHEIARLTSKGFSNKEIARILEISPHTVSTHLR